MTSKALGRCTEGHVNVAAYDPAAMCAWAKAAGKWVPPSKQKGKPPEGVEWCRLPLIEWVKAVGE